MHNTKRTYKYLTKIQKKRRKYVRKTRKNTYNYCKKGMTDEATRIFNLIK